MTAFIDQMVSMTRHALVDTDLPVTCSVTGGHDTRVVLALALAAGAQPATATIGPESHVDVLIGKRVAEKAGLSHERCEPQAPEGFDEDPVGAARRFAALTDGLSSLMQLQDVSVI